MSNPLKRGPTVLVSILDRLLDDEPHNRTRAEPPKSQNQVLRELKHSVRRDLENLLNTRWRATVWPLKLSELQASLVNYGIPDFCGENFGAQDPDELLYCIQFAIRHFEPRLKNVRVTFLENKKGESTDRTLKFRIDAILSVEPIRDRIAFDSSLEMTTGDIHVEGSAE